MTWYKAFAACEWVSAQRYNNCMCLLWGVFLYSALSGTSWTRRLKG